MNASAKVSGAELRVSAENWASLCSIFANPKRVMIVWSLLEEERSVGEIASDIEASLQCTSQHLRLMKNVGILDSRRDGQTIYYHIVKNGPADRCRLLLEAWNELESCQGPS